LGEVGRKYFEEPFEIIGDFLCSLGSVEEDGLAAEGIVEGVIGIFLGFLLDNIFSGSATGVVFFGSGLALVFFFPDARIENVESPGEIFYPS
jgi:hypothetical protein